MNELTKKGQWAEARRRLAPMQPIYGQTLGIIGCGNIGRLTAKKAQCFGLRILGNDPYVEKSLAAEYGTLLSLTRVLRKPILSPSFSLTNRPDILSALNSKK
jgi:phosphoglycerate dehydrogenase-like enzyme